MVYSKQLTKQHNLYIHQLCGQQVTQYVQPLNVVNVFMGFLVKQVAYVQSPTQRDVKSF